MSSVLEIYLKNKKIKEENRVTLLRLATSEARRLNDAVHFAYDKETLLTTEVLDSIIQYYSETEEYLNNRRKKKERELKHLWEALPKASSMEVYNQIKDEIEEIEEFLVPSDPEEAQYLEVFNIYYKGVFEYFKLLLENSGGDSDDDQIELTYYYE